MTSTGRKADPVWVFFDKVEVDGQKLKEARCKDENCKQLVSANVDRMKNHRRLVHPDPDDFSDTDTVDKTDAPPMLKQAKQGKLVPFVFLTFVTTSKKLKEELDCECARFVYATNSSFRLVNNANFLSFCDKMRPGYKPPERREVGGKLLDDEYDRCHQRMLETLKDKFVCLSIDGWSNVNNDPVIAVCVIEAETHEVFLLTSIDTTGHPHTTEYLVEIMVDAILKCCEIPCVVAGVVSDNAANMRAMRVKLGLHVNPLIRNVFTLGCAAHLANLISKDIRDDALIEKVKDVVKFFKNHHDPKARYKEAGGKTLRLPCDTRWNSVRDCLQSFVDNYAVLTSVVNTYRHVFNSKVVDAVLKDNLLFNSQFLITKMDRVAEALNKLQSDACYLSDSFEIWTELQNFFDEKSDLTINNINADLMNFKDRYDVAIGVPHILANMLDPRYQGRHLSSIQKQKAMEYLLKENEAFIPEYLKFEANTGAYLSVLFEPSATKGTNPHTWWKAISKNNSIPKEFSNFCLRLFSCVPSSASVERLFSRFGLVQTKLRNRLGIEKAAKLVSIFQQLNSIGSRNDENTSTRKRRFHTENEIETSVEIESDMSNFMIIKQFTIFIPF